MCFMIVQSMTFLRHRSYKIFLAIHVMFGIVVILGLFM